MAKKIVNALHSLNFYENHHTQYQEIFQQISQDICDPNWPLAVKKNLAEMGAKVAKHIAYNREVIESFGEQE